MWISFNILPSYLSRFRMFKNRAKWKIQRNPILFPGYQISRFVLRISISCGGKGEQKNTQRWYTFFSIIEHGIVSHFPEREAYKGYKKLCKGSFFFVHSFTTSWLQLKKRLGVNKITETKIDFSFATYYWTMKHAGVNINIPKNNLIFYTITSINYCWYACNSTKSNPVTLRYTIKVFMWGRYSRYIEVYILVLM